MAVRRRLLWVSLALCALVLALAALQYRWLGQVSDAERDRMRASVQARAAQIAEAFDREVTRAYVAIQIDPDTFQRKDWSRYAARVDTWRRSTAFPGIVGEILFGERSADGSVLQMRFDASTKTFEPSQWPQHANRSNAGSPKEGSGRGRSGRRCRRSCSLSRTYTCFRAR
jgi:hypothetical protein